MRRGEGRGEEGRGGGNRGDDTRVKQKVPDPRTGALWFGIAADVKCDLTVTLAQRQQSFCPPTPTPRPRQRPHLLPAALDLARGQVKRWWWFGVASSASGDTAGSSTVTLGPKCLDCTLPWGLGGGVLCMQIPLFLPE